MLERYHYFLRYSCEALKRRIFHDFNSDYKKDNYISKLLNSDTTEIVLYNRLKPLVKRVDIHNDKLLELVKISNDQYDKIKVDNNIKLYLGPNKKGRNQVAISLEGAIEAVIPQTINENLGIESFWLNNPFDYIKLQNKSVWMKSLGLLQWHHSNLHCGYCGFKTRSTESGHKRLCTNQSCRSLMKPGKDVWTNYPRIDPTVMILPTTKSDPINHRPACLLARKEKFPTGFMSCLTGFINPGETAEKAVVRELYEEVGLSCDHVRYHSSDYWPFPSTLLFGFSVEVPSSTNFLLDKEELSFGCWFNANEVDLLLQNQHPEYFIPPRFSVSFRMIEEWFKRINDA